MNNIPIEDRQIGYYETYPHQRHRKLQIIARIFAMMYYSVVIVLVLWTLNLWIDELTK